MATVVLNAYSKAYPSITNRIRASIYLQSDPQAFVAQIIDTTVGHPARTWSFPGLPRNNYGFVLDEIDGSGNVVTNLAQFDVVPGEIDGELVRDDEQIQVGTTTGFVAGATTATFDGTAGAPDYTGWEIVPSELTAGARGILIEGIDYSWNSTTGVFSLLQPGDVLVDGQYYNIHFNCQTDPAGNSYPTITDFEIVKITADTTLTSANFGKMLLIEPAGDYLEVTLPDILTVPVGRKMMVSFEAGAIVKCAKIMPFGADGIKFMGGTIYIIPNESFSIYRYRRAVGDDEWRVVDAVGNFLTCGNLVASDRSQLGSYNSQILDGTIGDVEKHARIYNEVVLNLPLGQAVDYDSWSSLANKYFYSLANSANPANAGKFRFPDRRNAFQRNTGLVTPVPGTFQASQNKQHGHTIRSINSGTSGSTTADVVRGNGSGTVSTRGLADDAGLGDKTIGASGGSEARPDNYSINQFVIL
jgi:hypothetical protein